MNKEILIAFLQKDIRELMMLTEGFESMEHFPEAILKMAEEKGQNIVDTLKKLSEAAKTELKVEEQSIPPASITLEVDEDFPQVDLPNDITALAVAKESREEFQEDIEVDEISEMEQIQPYAHKKTEQISLQKKEEIEPPSTSEKEAEKPIEKETSQSLGDKLSETGGKSLGDIITVQKIDDIRQALSIGDRFRFQRELFDNNGEEMNKAIARINNMRSMEEVLEFLEKRLKWDIESDEVADFIEILKKKF